MTDIKTLVERLRTDAIFDNTTLGNEAADAIEALQGENERLNKQHIERLLRIETQVDGLIAERDALAAELAGLKAQEPVGFVAPHDLKTLREGYPATVVMLPSNKRTEPLYAAPKALAPLTQPEVVEAFCNTRHNTQYVSVFDAGVRFAEKHHGIGGTP